MTLYLTSGKISHDPEPWVNAAPDFERGSTADVEEWQPRHGVIHDPRPEFDHHNPILVQFREREALDGRHNHYGAVQWANFTERVSYWDGSICAASPEQIDHAHRVLTKLAALS